MLLLATAAQSASMVLPTSTAASSRRAFVQRVAFAAAGVSVPAAWANTEPMLSEPMAGFNVDEAKRAAFEKKQKAYKKAWRREIGNFEFASNEKESVEAIEALAKARGRRLAARRACG